MLIVVVGDRRMHLGTPELVNYDLEEGGPHGCYLKAMANAVQIMHLAVAAVGLGSQWLSVSRTCEHKLMYLFDVPICLEIHTVVVIGYPAYEPLPPYRREFKEIVHYEKFDTNKHKSAEDILAYIRDLRTRTMAGYLQAKPYG